MWRPSSVPFSLDVERKRIFFFWNQPHKIHSNRHLSRDLLRSPLGITCDRGYEFAVHFGDHLGYCAVHLILVSDSVDNCQRVRPSEDRRLARRQIIEPREDF